MGIHPTGGNRENGERTNSCSNSPSVAFTLVELLVVLSIISILAALLLPALSRAKESGRSAACLGNLHQIGIALQLYVDESHNRMPTLYDLSTNNPPPPPTQSIDCVLAAQLGSPKILRCPSDNQQIFELTRSSYGWNPLVNGQDADHLRVFGQSLPGVKVALAFDKQNFHAALGASHSQNFLYADGHLKNRLELPGAKPQ